MQNFSLQINFNFFLCVLLLTILIFSIISPVLAQHAIPPEAWIEMRKMYRDKIPVTTMEEELAALAGPDARRAGPKLIDRGSVVLPEIHEALLKKDVEPRPAINYFHIIQALEDESSVDVILELLIREPDTPMKRTALLTLAKLPATEKAAEYIMHLASDKKEPWRIRRMAFTWFGLQKDNRGRTFAKELLEDSDPEIQATGLFVLAQLGDQFTLEPITKILTDGAPANMRDALLASLALFVPPEEFVKRTPKSLDWSSGYKDSLLYSRFLFGDEKDKPDTCRKLLSSSYPGYLKTAVSCLLESGHADDLRPFAAISLEAPGRDALIRNEIRKAGWKIIDTETEFKIVPRGTINGF